MTLRRTILILSDIHYACAAERERGCAEFDAAPNLLLRTFVRMYRNYIWKRDPFGYNHLLAEFLRETEGADLVVANGDYSCDTAFVGVSDDACACSVRECLNQLRTLGPKLRLVFGDHELGKVSLVGGRGGLRLASWSRAQSELGLEPFWIEAIGIYQLIGVTSSVLAFPVYEPEALPEERADWRRVRDEHLGRIRDAFRSLDPEQRVILFCHDPTALPFLWHDPEIRERLGQIQTTVIGHLHSDLFLWKSRLLSGMPRIGFMGNAIRRMSSALRDARLWRPFNVRLCPALSGIELLKDGGYDRMSLDPSGVEPPRFERRRFPRSKLVAQSRGPEAPKS